MKKPVYALNILSAIPGILIVPLAPFAFLIIDGEGRVPGLLHERAFIALLIAYPMLLPICLWRSLSALRRRRRAALIIAVAPLVCALALLWVFIAGGIRLR
ncbi:MAG: hypothetical protein ACR2P7_03040 [bacterium]